MGKKIFAGVLVWILADYFLVAQDTLSNNNNYKKQLKLEQIIGYTFGDKTSWTNISPEIFLGFDYRFKNIFFIYRLAEKCFGLLQTFRRLLF